MFISGGEEQILLTEFPDSPPVSTFYTDVGFTPEHEKNGLEQLTSNLEREIEQLRLKQRMLDEKRREALRKLLDIKGNIRVFCRIRPYLHAEKRRTSEPISSKSEKIMVKLGGRKKDFEFDKTFPQESSQESVFVEVEPILKSAIDGYNVCILAYGQTGTGKTFTMDGTKERPGIIPRALEELFRLASLDNSSSLTFSMSMLEVYMGNLRDLLAPRSSIRTYESMTKCNLNIQTDAKGMVEIEGLSEVEILDYSRARWWYNKGKRVRSTSWTNVNEASSRSHCLTRITIFRRGGALEAKREISKLWMVDLGGSERLLKTGATGLTLDEGRAINLSLSALADVIAALKKKKRGHVPYRNSKLTQILKDSLGDGSKVLMLVHISPFEQDVCETICSLSFARRARAIESNKEVPMELKKQRDNKIMELDEDIREVEKEVKKLRDEIQKVEFKLSENKKLFLNDDDRTPSSPKDDVKELIEASKKSSIKRNSSNSVPRFMTSTVASRQRQSAAERAIVGRATSFRSVITRSSIQFSASQSSSCLDPPFKEILISSNRKTRYAETDTVMTESPKCIDSDSKTTNPRSKMVTSSDPNLKVKLCRHRRMSDLI
ncbi:hypothetical protein L6164_035115 [Bauhinia variegata]|uniref:Uncharacterized protein n=1 Tax=Bauhinia variegata TaxID=167791 RepID=A0ACB9KX44_BAUVA|nr:hypothetical protein L6164_035115 [Bauhinia variegata]